MLTSDSILVMMRSKSSCVFFSSLTLLLSWFLKKGERVGMVVLRSAFYSRSCASDCDFVFFCLCGRGVLGVGNCSLKSCSEGCSSERLALTV